MAKFIHAGAWDYPLPLVRDGSTVFANPLYVGGYSLQTDFGGNIGRRVALFGDKDSMLVALGEAGTVTKDGEVWRVAGY